MPFTYADIVAVQLEAIAKEIPKLFPTKKVSAFARYRYSWERGWRTLALREWTISDGLYERFSNITESQLVREQIETQLSRYHWKDKAGRMRRVVEFDVFLQPE